MPIKSKPVKITPTMLAKDVLKLLAAKKITPTSGDYYFPSQTTLKSCSRDLQKAIKQKPFRCRACALGAIFVAHVGRVNDANTDDDFTRDQLREVFDGTQLDMIEAAFEQWGVGWGSAAYRQRMIAADAFGGAYKSPRTRLIAIMENIVKHGEFKPEAA